jgi:acyl-CoA dehydrogenase
MDEVSNIIFAQADRLFQEHATKEVLAAADGGRWPAELWQAIEDAGLPLALVPEAGGGVGLAPQDAASLIRRAAYYSVPAPLAETMVAQQLWIEAGGKVSAGTMTLAPVNPGERITLLRRGDDATLRGAARHVPWGVQADNVLIFARDERGEAFFCLSGRDASRSNISRRNVAYEPRENLTFDGVVLPAGRVRAAPNHIRRNGLLPYGAAIRAQQMVGGMERCLDYALAYANERVQFGRPIGKFQAIQHMLAVATGHFAAATAAADAMLESRHFGGDVLAIAVAKSRVGEAAGQVAAVCHQVHGAMGFTQEHPLHFATRRLWAWRDECGAEPYWQEWIGRTICRQGGEALWPSLVDPHDVMQSVELSGT